VRAHEAGHTEASIAVNRDAVPLAQRITVEEAAMRDLDVRIAQGTTLSAQLPRKAHATTASELAENQDKARAQLVTRRQAIAERIAKLKSPRRSGHLASLKRRVESRTREV